MPNLFTGSMVRSTLTGSGLGGTSAPYSSTSASASDCCCPSSTVFLDTLTTKLLAMTRSLQTQFEDLKKNQIPPSVGPRAPRLAEIKVSAVVSVKYAYYIYVQRYGPPVNGKFDPLYIDLINAEIALGKEHEDSGSDC
jgi:hypothetical protein